MEFLKELRLFKESSMNTQSDMAEGFVTNKSNRDC